MLADIDKRILLKAWEFSKVMEWVQFHQYKRSPDTQQIVGCCLLGFVELAETTLGVQSTPERALREHLQKRHSGKDISPSLSDWNDAKERSREDVLTLLAEVLVAGGVVLP